MPAMLQSCPCSAFFPRSGAQCPPPEVWGPVEHSPGGRGLSQTLPLELNSGPWPGPAFPRAVT